MCTGISEFKRDYQPRNKLVKNENGDLLADFSSFLNKLKNYSSQLFSARNGSDVRQIKVHNS
jgi:hypothetical protein